jgi:nitrate/TMAO reductase-like tetraheme cytochrome c subunit
MAENVWASMRETDSRECRNCHTYESMDLTLQDRSAKKKHSQERLAESGKTCIDCHQGIAHSLPEDY